MNRNKTLYTSRDEILIAFTRVFFLISSRGKVFTRIFFSKSHPGMKSYPYLFDRDELIPGRDFISPKTCKQHESFDLTQG